MENTIGRITRETETDTETNMEERGNVGKLKTKGSGSKQIDNNFVYTWNGRDTHADHGTGFLVDKQHSQAILLKTRPINVRLIHMQIQAKNTIENYIQCYAPLSTDEEDVKAYMIPST